MFRNSASDNWVFVLDVSLATFKHSLLMLRVLHMKTLLNRPDRGLTCHNQALCTSCLYQLPKTTPAIMPRICNIPDTV